MFKQTVRTYRRRLGSLALDLGQPLVLTFRTSFRVFYDNQQTLYLDLASAGSHRETHIARNHASWAVFRQLYPFSVKYFPGVSHAPPSQYNYLFLRLFQFWMLTLRFKGIGHYFCSSPW